MARARRWVGSVCGSTGPELATAQRDVPRLCDQLREAPTEPGQRQPLRPGRCLGNGLAPATHACPARNRAACCNPSKPVDRARGKDSQRRDPAWSRYCEHPVSPHTLRQDGSICRNQECPTYPTRPDPQHGRQAADFSDTAPKRVLRDPEPLGRGQRPPAAGPGFQGPGHHQCGLCLVARPARQRRVARPRAVPSARHGCRQRPAGECRLRERFCPRCGGCGPQRAAGCRVRCGGPVDRGLDRRCDAPPLCRR